MREAKDTIERLTNQLTKVHNELGEAKGVIAELHAQSQALRAALGKCSEEKQSERNDRITATRELKGRSHRLLNDDLRPRLRGAREALEGERPVVHVATERLERMDALIDKELEWLDSD